MTALILLSAALAATPLPRNETGMLQALQKSQPAACSPKDKEHPVVLAFTVDPAGKVVAVERKEATKKGQEAAVTAEEKALTTCLQKKLAAARLAAGPEATTIRLPLDAATLSTLPKTVPAVTLVEGDVDVVAVQTALWRHRMATRLCVDNARANDPALDGKTIDFQITFPPGAPAVFNVTGGTVTDTGLQLCVAQRLQKVDLPATTTQAVVRFTLTIHGGAGPGEPPLPASAPMVPPKSEPAKSEGKE